MAWNTKVPLWVINLAANFLIPDDAALTSGIKYGKLSDAVSSQDFAEQTGQAQYPGFVPNYSVFPETETTTEGVNWKIQFLKAVGFYGIRVTVLGFDATKINQWNFPLVRRQFGFVTLSRDDVVLVSEPLSYSEQFFIADSVLSLLSGYNDTFGISKLFNEADKFVCNLVSFYVNPTVQIQIKFLPVWEVWQLSFFQTSS